MEICNNGCRFTVTPDDGELFVDHSIKKRGGHLGHAMVEYEQGKILCFYPNCSGEHQNGHNGNGWMEYKRSEDGGQTWTDGMIFPYSKTLYDLNIGTYAMCEKAVKTPGGDIVIFTLLCELTDTLGTLWEPYGVPTYLRSSDDGKTWSAAERFGIERGRVWDVKVHDDKIYVLFESGGDIYSEQTKYHILVSKDDGHTFEHLSIIEYFSDMSRGRFYGTMEWLSDDSMIVYIYRENDEINITYSRSTDGGVTWDDNGIAVFKKRIRNMQMVKFGGRYFIFGRSGSSGTEEERGHFVMYGSVDGIHWDEGIILKQREAWNGAYSNTLIVHTPQGKERLLVQASHAYDMDRTNVYHWWIDEVIDSNEIKNAKKLS